MAGEKLKSALICIESNLNSLIEGLKHLQSVEKDPKKKRLIATITLMVQGVLSKIKVSINTVDVTDYAAIARIDSHVEQSHFTDLCKAFESAVISSYPKKKVLEHEEKLEWGKWKDSIENWLESIESLLDEWSEVAEGSAMQGVLKILSKAITALAKALSATK